MTVLVSEALPDGGDLIGDRIILVVITATLPMSKRHTYKKSESASSGIVSHQA